MSENNNYKKGMSLEDINTYYKPREIKHLYNDKIFDIKGIDYSNFIPMKFHSIQDKDIANIYTINGWYLLWYLMAKSYNKIYIETKISDIKEETELTYDSIKKALIRLEEINIINIYEKEYDKNTILHISIGYCTDYYNSFKKVYIKGKIQNGFRALPIEYLRTIISTLTPTQWAVLSVLFVYYSYYTPHNYKDKDDNIIEYNIMNTLYAFPNVELIGKLIGRTANPIYKALYGDKKLELNIKKPLMFNDNNIITITKGKYTPYREENNEARVKRENNRYYINLLQKFEYVYHHIYKIIDTRDKKIIDKIQKYGFEEISKTEEQNILIPRDFIKYNCYEQIENYNKWIKNNDIELYNKNKNKYELQSIIK